MSRNDTLSQKLLVFGLLLTVVAVGLFLLEKRRAASSGETAIAVPDVPVIPAIRGKQAPDFELPDLAGKPVRSEDFDGKVLLVNFWATWCAPCEIEIPWFIDFEKKYRSQGLEIIGISLDEEGPEVVRKYVDKRKISYHIVMGDEKTADAFGGILGLPTTYVVDRDGNFYSMHRGLVSKEIMERELQELLTEPGETASSRVSVTESEQPKQEIPPPN